MPDEDTPDTGAPADDPKPDTGDTVDWKAEAEKFKGLHRKQEERAKANAKRLEELEPLAKRAKELEDQGKTEIERLTEQLTQAQRVANDAEARALRFEIAAEHKLTPAQSKWLQGKDRDELEANVAELLEAFGATTSPEPDKKDDDKAEEPERDPNPRRRPQERLRPGAVPDADTEPVETDPRKLAALVRRDVF